MVCLYLYACIDAMSQESQRKSADIYPKDNIASQGNCGIQERKWTGERWLQDQRATFRRFISTLWLTLI